MKIKKDFFYDGQDLVFDSAFSIDRAMKGPWESYQEHLEARERFTDLTFPDKRMLIWQNHRTEVPSHDLYPIIEIVLHDWERLYDIGKGKYQLWDNMMSPISVHDVA